MLYNWVLNFKTTVVSPFLAHESIRNIFVPLLCLHLCFIHLRLIQFAYIDILHTKLISVVLRIRFYKHQSYFCVFEWLRGVCLLVWFSPGILSCFTLQARYFVGSMLVYRRRNIRLKLFVYIDFSFQPLSVPLTADQHKLR